MCRPSASGGLPQRLELRGEQRHFWKKYAEIKTSCQVGLCQTEPRVLEVVDAEHNTRRHLWCVMHSCTSTGAPAAGRYSPAGQAG